MRWKIKHCNRMLTFFFFFIINRWASRLIETQMDLPCLLFGVGFFLQIFIVTPQMFRSSRDYVENVRG